MESITYNTMDYNELDKLIKEYFPKSNFEFIADQEMGNDSEKDCGLFQKQSIISSFDEDNYLVETMLGTKVHIYMVRRFIQFFVNAGIIPEGRYLIKVSW